MRLPSRSQLTEGLGLPKAVQVKVMLPPSLASTYWGGVSENVGGAEESEDSLQEKKKQGHVNNASFWSIFDFLSKDFLFWIYISINDFC